MRAMQSDLGKHQFVRAHGLGNDYLVVDERSFGLTIGPSSAARICHRHTGVGSDGILLALPPPNGFDAAVRIFNPDGSEAEKSGNGVRIFAKFCFDHCGADAARRLRIHTLGGPVEAQVIARHPDRTVLRVSMGKVSFRCADLPMTAEVSEWIEQPLAVGDRSFRATCLSVGNPHAVLFDAPFDDEALRHYGPLVESHIQFPRRTNVQFVRVRDRRTVEALIWERGAGRTESSGSSACAVAAACVRANLTDRSVSVVMPGGTLEVTVQENWELEQVGFAQEIAVGRLSRELVAELG